MNDEIISIKDVLSDASIEQTTIDQITTITNPDELLLALYQERKKALNQVHQAEQKIHNIDYLTYHLRNGGKVK